MTAVADASVLVAALTDASAKGDWARDVVAAGVCAPHLVLVEAASALRRLERSKSVSLLEAVSAYRDLVRGQVSLLEFAPFAERIWELRSAISVYDAWYVAIAETYDLPLATLDGKLVRAAGPKCKFTTPP